MKFTPMGRHVKLKKVNLQDESRKDKEDTLGIEGFDFGFDSSTKTSLKNDMFEVYEVVEAGKGCTDFMSVYCEGSKVVVYNNVTEKINILGEDVYFTLENNIVGMVE